MLFTVVVLMPLAAVAVSGAGWIGRSLVSQGVLLGQDIDGKDVFVRVVERVCAPGLFGFVMAALLAALMSTLEALINALSAVAVNDVWRPFLKPGRPDAYYLRVARYVAIAGYVVGLPLIPPLAHGEPIDPSDPTWRQYSYMRSLYGLAVSGVLGVTITRCTRPKVDGELSGLVMSSIHDALRRFKGGEPNERWAGVSVIVPIQTDSVTPGTSGETDVSDRGWVGRE